MTKEEYAVTMARLVEYIKIPMTDNQMAEYYPPLARTAADDFNAAVDDLIANFRPQYQHTFPLVPDFKEAINAVVEKRIRAATENFHCEQCWGFGAVIVPDGGQGQETFCTCPAGQKRRDLRRQYVEDHGRGYRAPAGFKSAPPKIKEWLPYKDPPEIPDDVPAIVEHVEKGMESEFKFDTGEDAWNEMLRKAKVLLGEKESPAPADDDVPF